MSDHWNLLADLLGTPNYAPRAKKGSKAEPSSAAEVGGPVEPAKSSDSGSGRQSDRSVVSHSDSAEPELRQPVQEVREEVPAKEPVKERSMLQSSWDALAGLFGVTSEPVRESQPVVKVDKEEPRQTTTQRGGKHKKNPAKSMWDKPQEAPVEDAKPQLQDSSLPSFTRDEPTTAPSTESDRRGPRRSPRRGQSDRGQNDRGQSDRGSEGFVEGSQAIRNDVREESEREPRSNRNDSRGDSREDRNSRPARREREPRPMREENRDESNRRKDPRERNTREDRGRSSTPNAVAKQESSRRAKPSGFAAGLDSDVDSSDNELIAFQADEDSFRDDETVRASSSHQSPRGESESGQRGRRKKRRGRRREDEGDVPTSKSESTEQDSSGFEHDDDFDRSDDGSESRPRHGKIPSWTETIGIVVQANVANHQKQSAGGGRSRQRRPNN